MSDNAWQSLVATANGTTGLLRRATRCRVPAPPFVAEDRMFPWLHSDDWLHCMFDCIQADGPLRGWTPDMQVVGAAWLDQPRVRWRHIGQQPGVFLAKGFCWPARLLPELLQKFPAFSSLWNANTDHAFEDSLYWNQPHAKRPA